MKKKSITRFATKVLMCAIASVGLLCAAQADNTYMIIDVSGGIAASSYPVSYLDAEPSDGWTDEYKTTKIVLRKIPAGAFTMGSPSDELGRDSDETQHSVTLTKDFYIGVFPVTQKQWERVMGSRPSHFINPEYRDSRPVDTVSYFEIREHISNTAVTPTWPESSNVDESSFIGTLRMKTGLATLDLPTEAQWEYACRAGTTTALNSGKNLTAVDSCPNMSEVGRYFYNHPGGHSVNAMGNTKGGTAAVGSYKANAWGLYDMHGNIWEWCLDWYGAYPETAVTDPAGAESGAGRVIRSGGWNNFDARFCRSANRFNASPSIRKIHWDFFGFRLASTLP